VGPTDDPLAKNVAFQTEQNAAHRRARGGLTPEAGKRSAGEHANLQRSNDPARILQVDLRSPYGIELLQTLLQVLERLGGKLCPQRLIARRQTSKPVSQRPHVKAGAADDHRNVSTLRDLVDASRRQPAI